MANKKLLPFITCIVVLIVLPPPSSSSSLRFGFPKKLMNDNNNINKNDDDDDISKSKSKSMEALIIECVEKEFQEISEAIYTQTNSSFQEVLDSRIYNLRYQKPTTRKPLLIIAPKSELNVAAVITCARANGVKIKTRSGGHDFEGISYTAPFPFILLDLANLNGVEVEIEGETAGSAWVQSGATLGQIYYRIAEKSPVHAFPAGVCPTVGAGGHFSGGGYGTLMRKYGLSVDNIVDARIVDSTGRILDREAMGEDLFWAIRGGGGSSFGVILAWKLTLVPVPPTVTVFNVDYYVNHPGVNHIIYKWQTIAHKLPKDLLVRVETSAYPTTPTGNLSIKASFISMFLGDGESLLKIMDKSFPELGVTREDCKQMSWIDSVMFWNHIPQGTPREILLNYDIKHPAYRKIKGDFIKKPIPEAALPKVWEKMMETGLVYMEWTPFGGRMDEIDESEVPFAHRRGNLFMIFYDLLWVEDDMDEFYLNKAKELYQFMGQFVSHSPREAVLNYVDLDVGSSLEKYFKANFPKLVMVKTRVDPTNFFSHEQSIPTLYMLLENRDFKRGYNNFLRLSSM